MPHPTWVSEIQPEIGSLPTGVISTGAAVGGAGVGSGVTVVVSVVVVVVVTVGTATGGGRCGGHVAADSTGSHLA